MIRHRDCYIDCYIDECRYGASGTLSRCTPLDSSQVRWQPGAMLTFVRRSRGGPSMEALLVRLLSPFLPRLLGRAGKIADKVADGTADTAWNLARKVWSRLADAIKSHP